MPHKGLDFPREEQGKGEVRKEGVDIFGVFRKGVLGAL
jgi:hypothetical protein